jgi:hypothetical protein
METSSCSMRLWKKVILFFSIKNYIVLMTCAQVGKFANLAPLAEDLIRIVVEYVGACKCNCEDKENSRSDNRCEACSMECDDCAREKCIACIFYCSVESCPFTFICETCAVFCNACHECFCKHEGVEQCASTRCSKNVCEECAQKCSACDEVHCDDCLIRRCNVCEDLMCEECGSECDKCMEFACLNCCFECPDCRKTICERCGQCENCDNLVCYCNVCISCSQFAWIVTSSAQYVKA